MAIYAVGMSVGVGLALLAISGPLDGAIDKLMYVNCVKARPNAPLRCITAEHALDLDYCIP